MGVCCFGLFVRPCVWSRCYGFWGVVGTAQCDMETRLTRVCLGMIFSQLQAAMVLPFSTAGVVSVARIKGHLHLWCTVSSQRFSNTDPCSPLSGCAQAISRQGCQDDGANPVEASFLFYLFCDRKGFL